MQNDSAENKIQKNLQIDSEDRHKTYNPQFYSIIYVLFFTCLYLYNRQLH